MSVHHESLPRSVGSRGGEGDGLRMDRRRFNDVVGPLKISISATGHRGHGRTVEVEGTRSISVIRRPRCIVLRPLAAEASSRLGRLRQVGRDIDTVSCWKLESLRPSSSIYADVGPRLLGLPTVLIRANDVSGYG